MSDPALSAMKVPPHSVEAEQSLLGGLMLDNQAWDKIADLVAEEDFYQRDHRLLFRAIRELAEHSKPFDAVTLSEWLDQHNELDNVGGLQHVATLAKNTPSAANIVAYADIVRERSVLRQLAQVGTEISDSVFNAEGEESKALLDQAEQKVFQIAEQNNRTREGFVAIKPLLTKAVERIDTLFNQDNPITGLPTGFADFDEKTSGLQNGDLVIVAGRPSMGKCCEENTEVLLANGSLTTIKAIYQQQQAKLLTLAPNWKLKIAQPSHFVDDGHKPVFKVTTKLGRSIETTLTHPYLTIDGWRALAELNVGHKIAVPRKLAVFGTVEWRQCEVKLLAYLLGDGCMTGSQPLFTNNNKQLQQDFIQSVEEFGGVKARVVTSSDRATNIFIAADPLVIEQNRQLLACFLKQKLQALNLSQQQLANQLQTNASSVSNWVNGHYVPNHATLEKLVVLLSLTPTESNVDNYGMLSNHSKNTVTLWLERLGVWGKNAHQKLIPASVFQLTKPQLALLLNRLFATDGWASVLASGQSQLGYCSVSEQLCHQIQHLLLRFGIISRLKHRQIKYQDGHQSAWQLDITDQISIQTFIEEIGILSKQSALKKVEMAIQQRRYQTNSDLIWDEIVSIESMGYKQVYDLTIPDTHNFIANDICVHNTTYAMNIAENSALKQQTPVAIFSMEMPGEQLVLRMLSSLGRINQQKVRSGKLEDDDWPRLTSAVSILSETKIFIDDTPALTPTEIRAKARRLKREHGLGLIVIDYLQLMQTAGKSDNRTAEISEISRSLKGLAKELDLPVIALSQLNRNLEQRPNKRPVMSDLRESGSIEQDADVIVFIYRDEVYNEDSADKGKAEIIIGKQRNGPIGVVRLAFLGEYTRFENYIEDEYGADFS